MAVVTGAGGPLGAATATTLAAGGLTVVGVDRNPNGLSALPDHVRREVGEMGTRDAATAVFDRIATLVGPPDVVVNTIGAFRAGSVADTDEETLALMLAVNVATPLWISQAAAALMRPRGRGAIIHVAAKQGLDAGPGVAAYSMSKAALIHLVRVLDAELKSVGIRVNAVVPRLLDTPANRATFSAEAMARAVSPAAVADVIAYLASEAAGPVTGAVVPVYGPG